VSYDLNPDVAVIGAGFAGLAAAHRLSVHGVRTTLIDRLERCPTTFKAEKFEPDQVALLRRLDLLEHRRPHAPNIGECLSFDGSSASTFELDQFGISYRRTVDRLRDALPTTVSQVRAGVEAVTAHPLRPRIELSDGHAVLPRLVVVATGKNDRLLETLGMRRAHLPNLVSTTFGFDVEPLDRGSFPFNGFNYEPPPNPNVDYLTMFPIGARMRVNLFTSLAASDERVRRFKREPDRTLGDWFPGIHEQAGRFRVATKVQVGPTSFYRLSNPVRPGVVVISDEFQSVHPGTGKGLTKALTDVSTLCERYVGIWLKSDRITAKDVARFYKDPDKRAADAEALGKWYYYRDRARGGVSFADRIRRRLRRVA